MSHYWTNVHNSSAEGSGPPPDSLPAHTAATPFLDGQLQLSDSAPSSWITRSTPLTALIVSAFVVGVEHEGSLREQVQ